MNVKVSISLLTIICGLTTAVTREHFYVNINMNWTDAQSYCRTHYIDLSTITSQGEESMIVQQGGIVGMVDKWIGLHRNESNINQFLWSDGNPFSYSDWEPGQPNNLNGNQHCVSLTDKWYDYECYNSYTFFCYKVFILVKENMTWDEALQYCRSHHTDLASMTTEIQLQLTEIETADSQTENVWTGLRYLAGEWFWVNNQTLGVQTSLPECPNQPFRCGARNTKTEEWENRDCTEKLNFLCN